jgi:hypothetical protein
VRFKEVFLKFFHGFDCARQIFFIEKPLVLRKFHEKVSVVEDPSFLPAGCQGMISRLITRRRHKPQLVIEVSFKTNQNESSIKAN